MGEEDRKIYSLAPEALTEMDDDGKVYKEYLSDALQDNTIHNIALTGNFGVGKSRFLRAYSNSEKKNFLFVSACDFLAEGQGTKQENVEYSLLYQLLLGCEDAGLPLRVLPKSVSKRKQCMAVLLGGMVGLTALTLLLSSQIGAYTRALGLYDMAFSAWLHLGLYLLLVMAGSIACGWLFRHLLMEWKVKKISLKSDYAELDVEKNAELSILDRYRSELIFALTEMAERIDYTVIFEDMDRLEQEQSIPIFTKLRELNQMVNIRLNRNGRHMKFIYVVHDALFVQHGGENGTVQEDNLQLKFFDYILPVVPALSRRNGEVELNACFENIEFCSNGGAHDFIVAMAPFLADYRLIHNIANEYQVFREIGVARSEDATCETVQKQLMALVVYKNLMPEDYKRIREGTSKVFPFRDSADALEPQDEDRLPERAVRVLQENGWLIPDCLRYLGFQEGKVQKVLSQILQGENYSAKKILLQQDFEKSCRCLQKLSECGELENALRGIEYSFLLGVLAEESGAHFTLLDQYAASSVCAEQHEQFVEVKQRLEEECPAEHGACIVRYLCAIGCTDFDWFFPNQSDPIEKHFRCWSIICKLSRDTLCCFYERCRTGDSNQFANWLNSSSMTKSSYWPKGAQVPPNDCSTAAEVLRTKGEIALGILNCL